MTDSPAVEIQRESLNAESGDTGFEGEVNGKPWTAMHGNVDGEQATTTVWTDDDVTLTAAEEIAVFEELNDRVE